MNDKSVIAVYDTHQQAEQAVKEMQKSGFNMNKLSIVGKGYHSEESPVGFYTTGDRIKHWGSIGAFWGSLWGLLMGAAFFWVPGIGPLAIAGPFTHLLVTALEGAVLVGGVTALGAGLASLGVPKGSIVKYETQLKAEKYLLIAHGTSEEVARAKDIIKTTATSDLEVYSTK